MANYKSKRKITKAIVVDEGTGEVENKVIVTDVPVRVAEEYIRNFTTYIYDLAKQLTPMEFVVFILLAHNTSYNTNSFKIDKEIKQKICDSVSVVESRLLTIISELSKKGVLIRQERGKYIVDPKYAFKGTEDGRVTVNITIGQINMSCDVSNQTGSVTINPAK